MYREAGFTMYREARLKIYREAGLSTYREARLKIYREEGFTSYREAGFTSYREARYYMYIKGLPCTGRDEFHHDNSFCLIKRPVSNETHSLDGPMRARAVSLQGLGVSVLTGAT